MCLAAVALRFAFPHESYIIRETYLPSITSSSIQRGTTGIGGRIVTMQSISSNLKETMNPKDIMHGKALKKNFFYKIFNEMFILDAIHNFHPQYRDYTQYNPHVSCLFVCMYQ